MPTPNLVASLSRREALFGLGTGLGSVAFSSMLHGTPGTHHAPRAKRCIFLMMEGGPSHLESDQLCHLLLTKKFKKEAKELREQKPKLERKPSKQQYKWTHRHVCRIQAWVRRFLLRRRYLRQKAAVQLIQKHVRRHQVRGIFLDIRSAVVFLQTFFRYRLRRNKYKPEASFA